MKKILIIITVLLIATYAIPAKAQYYTEESSRKGVYLALVGFGGYEALETEKAALQGGLRVGGGILENLMLYLEATAGWMNQTQITNLFLFDGQIKAQYYFWDGFYMNLGAGVSTGRVQTLWMPTSQTKTGPIISAGSGYEFRLGRKFFLAPEARIDYRRLAGKNYLVAAVGGQLGWHF